MNGSGLVVRGGGQSIPLEHVHVDAHVVDVCARVTVRQSYRNRESVPLEVVYVFPLDEGAAVCGFEATVDGVRYVGRATEREEAFRQYDDALEAGHGAFLLDEERADVFTASLGNVKPGSAVELSIAYVTELAAEGPAARFTLPTTVSPRYAPDRDRAGVSPTPAESLNPPVALDVPYGFTFDMDVTMGGAIRGIQSATHPIEIEQDGPRAKVRLAQRSAPMDRDLVIVIAAEGLDTPHATVERGEKGGAALVSFVPRFEAAAQPAEVVFVIDRSGSMEGTSIEEVRNALQLCLRSLTTGSRFNIVSFGSTFATLFRESRPYDDSSLQEASAFVRGTRADMGGTELLPALQWALEQPPVAGMPRQVLLLTDGEVTNTDEVIDLARRHASGARCFTFGIGAGASQHLVNGIARASGGAAEFISPGERIEAKVLRQFARVFAPALLDARVDWGQAGVVAAADHLPPIFNGERASIYALLNEPRRGTVRLSGTLAGRAVAFDLPIDPASAVQGDTIATLAARARIRTLEEAGEYLENRGSLQRRGRSNAKAAAEIAALGVKYQLASRETSFVAIEHRETLAEGRAELRRVPVALTSGWGDVMRQSHQPGRCASAPAMSGPVAFDIEFARLASDVPDLSALRAGPAQMRDSRVSSHAWLPARLRDRGTPAPPPAAQRPLDALVALQRADGSWDLDAAFAKAVSLKMRALEKELRKAAGDPDAARRALATAVALAWLEKHAAAERVEWELLAKKATAWLSASGTEPAPGQGWNAWLDAARRLV